MLKSLSELAPNPENPRKISNAKLEQLGKALHEFGDLGGIIFNRKTGHLVSGHQRSKLLDSNAEIQIERTYKKPTRTGTVAEGFVLLDGERIQYREVLWSRSKAQAAALAANRTAGDWDNALLSDWFSELSDFNYDLDLTLFDEKERHKFFEDPKPEKKERQRVASDGVKQVQLSFSEAHHSEFMELIDQTALPEESISDTLLRVLRRVAN